MKRVTYHVETDPIYCWFVVVGSDGTQRTYQDPTDADEAADKLNKGGQVEMWEGQYASR